MQRKIPRLAIDALRCLPAIILIFLALSCFSTATFSQTPTTPQQRQQERQQEQRQQEQKQQERQRNAYIIAFRDTSGVQDAFEIDSVSTQLSKLLFSETEIAGFVPFDATRDSDDSLWLVFTGIAPQDINKIPRACKEVREKLLKHITANRAKWQDFFEVRRLQSEEIPSLSKVLINELSSPCRFKKQFYNRYTSEYAPVGLIKWETTPSESESESENMIPNVFFVITIDPSLDEDHFFVNRIGQANAENLEEAAHRVRNGYVAIDLEIDKIRAQLPAISSITKFIEKTHFMESLAPQVSSRIMDQMSQLQKGISATKAQLAEKESALEEAKIKLNEAINSKTKWTSIPWLYIIPMAGIIIFLLEMLRRANKSASNCKKRIFEVRQTNEEELSKTISKYDKKIEEIERNLIQKNRLCIPD
jgi:hypothetical protein